MLEQIVFDFFFLQLIQNEKMFDFFDFFFDFLIYFFLQLIQNEKMFDDTNDEDHQQRQALLAQALLRFVTKPNKEALTPVSVVTVAREVMLNIADNGVWQFFSARGMSGSKKMCMKTTMPATYAMIRGIVIKIIDCSQKTADKAISNVLKNCCNRKGAKAYLERLQEGDELINENFENMSPLTIFSPTVFSKHISRRPKSPPGNNHSDNISRKTESQPVRRNHAEPVSKRTESPPIKHC